MSHMRDCFTLPPVGTIYWSRAHECAWKVVKCAEKTLWLQEIKVDRSRIGPPDARLLNQDRGCNHAPHRQYGTHLPRREHESPPH